MHAHDVIDELLEEERRVLSLYRRKVAEEADLDLRAFLLEVFAARERHVLELEESRRTMTATDEVTRQINDVYL
jgi:hypothetical protein